MSNVTLVEGKGNAQVPGGALPDNIDAWFEKKFNECFEKREAAKTGSMAIIVTLH